MMQLLEVRLRDEVVLRAPIEVLDREKAREALVGLLEDGSGYGIDSMVLAAIFRATSEYPQDYTAIQISFTPQAHFTPV